MRVVPTRQEDLRSLDTPVLTHTGEEIHDIMRFMNGDNPAAALEDGTQRGGHFGCVGCDGNINNSHDLAYSLERKYKTLEEKKSMCSQAQQEERVAQILSKTLRLMS